MTYAQKEQVALRGLSLELQATAVPRHFLRTCTFPIIVKALTGLSENWVYGVPDPQ